MTMDLTNLKKLSNEELAKLATEIRCKHENWYKYPVVDIYNSRYFQIGDFRKYTRTDIINTIVESLFDIYEDEYQGK